MTHVRVKFNSTATRYAEEIISANTIIRDYLESKGSVINGAHFTANAAPITDKLHMTFSELTDRGVVAEGATILIYETIKTSNAK